MPAAVHDHAGEPGAQGAAAPTALEIAPERDERLLHDLLDLRGLPSREPPGQGRDAIAVPFDESVEGGGVAEPTRFQQLLVGLHGWVVLHSRKAVAARGGDPTPFSRFERVRPLRHARTIPLALLALLLLGGRDAAGAGAALPEGVPIGRAGRLAEPPRIDGRIDPGEWEGALVLEDLRQVDPVPGGPPSEATRILVAVDARFLYVAVRCFDRDPEGIVATVMKRDASLGSDDRVSLVVDPWDDRRNGYLFESNPLGAKADALVEDNQRTRREWDGIWEARATIDAEGWTVEFALPAQTLAFDPRAERWSFNVERVVRRRNERIRWASPSLDVPLISVADAGAIEGIEGLEIGVGLDVKPYGRASAILDDDDADFESKAGLDLAYRITPALTLTATLNTDFAETEVDERRVNLTRFPLFFPEKRDFFLQDAGIFEFGGIRQNPLPYFSRRIGIGPDGAERDILAGLKLTGRVGALNVGLLDVQMKHDEVLGDKNLFVGRASINVLEQSSIGVIATSGDPTRREDALLGGADFNYRTSDWNGSGRTLQGHVWVQRSEAPGEGAGQWAYGAKIEYPNDRVNWRAGYSEIQEHFDAPLGFVPRRAIREYFGSWRYRWRPEGTGVRRVDVGAGFFLVTDLDDEVESRSVSFDALQVESDAGDVLALDASLVREVLSNGFRIFEDIVVPVGDYRWERYGVRVATSSGRPVSGSVRWRTGGFYTGTRQEYAAAIDWRVSPHLNLGAELEYNDVDLEEGDFLTRIVRARVNVAFTPDLTWSTFVQFDDVSDSVGINSRVRWIVKPGSEMNFVVNQASDLRDGGFAPLRTELTTKVGWTFRF